MENNQVLEKILTRLDSIDGNVTQNTNDIKGLTSAVAESAKDIAILTLAVAENTKDIRDLTSAVAENTKDIRGLVEIVDFIKDSAVTKDEFDEKFESHKNEIISHIDSFIVITQKLDVEFLAMRSKHDRLESQIHQLARHLNIELTP